MSLFTFFYITCFPIKSSELLSTFATKTPQSNKHTLNDVFGSPASFEKRKIRAKLISIRTRVALQSAAFRGLAHSTPTSYAFAAFRRAPAMHSLRRAALRLHAPSTYAAASSSCCCLRRLSTHRRAPPPPRSAATGDDEWNDAWETAWLPGDSPASSPAPAAPWESPASASASSVVPPITDEVDPDTKAFVADMDERWAERRGASRRAPSQRASLAAEGGEGGAAAKKKAQADEYRTRKQRVHAALWVKEIEKMEEARLGGGGVGADDIDRLLDSCSEYVAIPVPFFVVLGANYDP